MTSTSRPSAWGRIIGPPALALLIALLVLVTPAQAAFPGGNGEIWFERSGVFEQPDLVYINPDGTGANTNGCCGEDPAWSLSGTDLAYDTVPPFTEGCRQIFTNSAQLTDSCPDHVNPTWSPTGRKVAFAAGGDIYVANADGSGTPQTITSGPVTDGSPSWSPDGTKIAFQSDRDGNAEIYTMNPDGSGVTRLTTNPALDLEPNWSPDGAKIAFETNRDGNAEIYTMNRDGSGVGRLTTNAATDGDPAWSPDGTKIAFVSNRDTATYFYSSIFTMNADGSAQTNITRDQTPGQGEPSDPDWRPVNPASYPRPVGASPMRVSLVPAFVPCDPATANATHPAPLSGASCSPPAPRSSLVAVGPRSLGFARMIVLGSGGCAPFDSTHCYPDVTIRFNITDVRSGSPTGPDYATPSAQDLTGIATLPGDAQGSTTQITDQNNQSLGDPSGPYDKSATVVPLKFPVPIDCVAVANPIDGSACSAQTTANTLVPGSAVAGKRAIWELGQFQVLDQGGNGTPGDTDDKVFEVQGVFIP